MPHIKILQSVAGDPGWTAGEIVRVSKAVADTWADGERAELLPDDYKTKDVTNYEDPGVFDLRRLEAWANDVVAAGLYEDVDAALDALTAEPEDDETADLQRLEAWVDDAVALGVFEDRDAALFELAESTASDVDDQEPSGVDENAEQKAAEEKTAATEVIRPPARKAAGATKKAAAKPT